ncbi:MAG: adenosine deaminase [Pseudomonadota bacterium]
MKQILRKLSTTKPNQGGQGGHEFLQLMQRVTGKKDLLHPIMSGVASTLDDKSKTPVILVDKSTVPSTNFSKLRPEILKTFQLPPKSTIVSVFGDSKPYDARGSNQISQTIWNYFTPQTNGKTVALFGATGRPWAKDQRGNETFDINGAITRSNVPTIAQIVDQTSQAIEKWGCDTPNPLAENKSLTGIIYITGRPESEAIFGDDIGLEGQFDNEKLDLALIDKISEQENLPQNIATIISAERPEKKLNEIERQQLMHFSVERKLDFTDRLKLDEVLIGGIGDEAFIASGGGQSLWQATLNAVLGKNIVATGSLRGADNVHTTIKVTGADEVERDEYRDFADAAELMGYLAREKTTNPEIDFFTLWEKYFNGNETRGYPLSGIRLAYNPGNDDVARADEAKGGLNSKMRLVTNSAFALGCLGGYQNNFDPAKINCKILTLSGDLLPYDEAASAGLAPSFENPHGGKYHDHDRTHYHHWMRTYGERTNEKEVLTHLVENLIDELGSHNQPITTVLDVGCGDGILSKQIAAAAAKANPVEYLAIDSSNVAVKRATKVLETIPGVTAKVEEGDCFAKLPGTKKANLAIISHSAYFAGEKMPQFVESVIDRLDHNGLAIFIHDGKTSDVKTMYRKYSAGICDDKTSEKISEELTSLGVKYQTVHFVSSFRFPEVTEEIWQSIVESPSGPKLDESQDCKTVRNLLAFNAQRSLADFSPQELQEFIVDSKKMLAQQNNILYVDNICHIAISREHDLEFPNLVKEIAAKIQQESFIKGLPVAELHMHLDGSLEAEMMFEIAKRNEVPFPYDSVEATRAAYNFSNLSDFLNLYFLGASVMKTEQDFEDLTYAYLKKAHLEGVSHAEMFVGPQTHTVRGVPFDDVMNGTCKAIERAKQDFGISSNLILDFQRDIGRNENSAEMKEKVAQEAAEKTLDSLIEWQINNPQHRDKVVGVGLDYQETGFPPHWFKDVFARAKTHGLKLTCHAGEEGPAEYVWQAINHLDVDRIDHGNRSIEDAELMRLLAERQLPLTMCPLSNQALGQIKPEEHPLKIMMEAGIKVTVNSDDPAYFRGPHKSGYVKGNLIVISKALKLSDKHLRDLATNSITASFLSPPEKEIVLAHLGNYCDRYESIMKPSPSHKSPSAGQLVDNAVTASVAQSY